MTTYGFRLKFRTATRFDDKGQSVTVSLHGLQQPIQLNARKGLDSNWLYATSSGYVSQLSAQEAGERLITTILLAAAQHSFGAECDSRSRLSFSTEVVETYKAKTGRNLIPDRSGLVIFEDGPFDFIGAEAAGETIEHITSLSQYLEKAAANSGQLNERQLIAAELINDTFFQSSSDAIMILSVTAVEALCPAAQRSSFFRFMMSCTIFMGRLTFRGLRLIRTSYADDAEEMIKVLEGQRDRASVRQGYLLKLRKLLGKEAAKEFDIFYGRRSKFVHEGLGRGSFSSDAYRVRAIALDLLLADLAIRP